MARSLAALLVVLATVASVSAGLQCISDSGKPIDWWVAFKYPSGRQYSYSEASTTSFKKSAFAMQDGWSGALDRTLAQLYGTGSSKYTRIFYNDQPPESRKREVESSSNGHAKGVIAIDDTGAGFWLVHSTPLFPRSPASTTRFQFMGDSQVQNGQNFLCMSFDSWQRFNSIGKQLQYMRPDVYFQQFTTVARQQASILYDYVVDGKFINTASSNAELLRSNSGVRFTSFAKTAAFGRSYDMWRDLIGKSLNRDMIVQTWRRGAGDPLPSSCRTTPKVQNIDELFLHGSRWAYLRDHSKWGITTVGNFYCAGDINRMASQGERAGGAVCFESATVRNGLFSAISKTEAC